MAAQEPFATRQQMALTLIGQGAHTPHPAVPDTRPRIGQQVPPGSTQAQTQFGILKKEEITVVQATYRL